MKNIRTFYLKIFIFFFFFFFFFFLVVKFSIYLNRRVFVMYLLNVTFGNDKILLDITLLQLTL